VNRPAHLDLLAFAVDLFRYQFALFFRRGGVHVSRGVGARFRPEQCGAQKSQSDEYTKATHAGHIHSSVSVVETNATSCAYLYAAQLQQYSRFAAAGTCG